MTDDHTTTTPAHSAFRVLAALADLGQATAAQIAAKAELGYSTTTPKLRAWEDTGQVERFRADDGRTLWRLTNSGRAATAAPHSPHTSGDDDTPTAPAGPDAPTGPGTPAEPDDAVGPGPDREPGHAQPHGDPDPQPEPEPAEDPAAGPEPADSEDAPRQRRSPGTMRAAVLDVCEAHPGRQFKVGELCRLIDDANAGSGAAKASPGAVYNAATKLAAAGTLIQTVERPATFQLTADGD